MDSTSTVLVPIFTEEAAYCGICHAPIKPNSVAHGHSWTHEKYQGPLFDLFHRICIQDILTHGPPNCPSCSRSVINAEDYDQSSDLSRKRLLFQENRIVVLTAVKCRNFPVLGHIFKTITIIPDSIQLEAVEIAASQNDTKMMREILFNPQFRLPPSSLILLLNIAAQAGFDQIVKVFLDYNDVYLLRTNVEKINTFYPSDIHSAAQLAISNGYFGTADLLLHAQYAFEPDMWADLFYLSIQKEYWEGMRRGLDSGLAEQPDVLEKGLLIVARRGDLGMILALLHVKGDQPLDLGPQLLAALENSHPRAAQILLKHADSLDPNVRSTAVQIASTQGYEELLATLIENGPISRETHYWAQAGAKTQKCLEILSNAQIY